MLKRIGEIAKAFNVPVERKINRRLVVARNRKELTE